jgi:hypothetical protein
VHDLADAGPAGGFGQPHGAHHVDRGVERRVVDRIPHRDLGGQVEHHFRPGFAEQPDQVGIDDVALDELEMSTPLGPAEVLASPGAEVVHADDGVSVREEAVYQR